MPRKIEFLHSDEFRSCFDINTCVRDWDGLVAYLESKIETYAEDYIPAEVKKMNLGSEDIIVLKYPETLSSEAKEHLDKNMKRVAKNKVIVLEGGMDIEVLKKEEAK